MNLSGEHMDQFESFESKRFVSRLLGKGDVKGMMDKIQVCIDLDPGMYRSRSIYVII